MLSIPIPGRSTLQLQHVVLDYNGTIALDGELIPGVEDRLARLAAAVTIHILTADTHGTVRAKCGHLNARIQTFPRRMQPYAKPGSSRNWLEARAVLGMATTTRKCCEKRS